MKRFTLLFLAAIAMMGCSDDDSSATSADNFIGTWALKREWINNTEHDINACRLEERMTFNSDNTFEALFDDDNGNGNPNNCDMQTTDGTFTYSGDVVTLTFMDGEEVTLPLTILELTESKLVYEINADGGVIKKQQFEKI